MSYQDISQVSELLLVKLRSFFMDAKSAKIALSVSVLLLALCLYNLYSLYSANTNWQPIEISSLNNATISSVNGSQVVSKKHLFGQIIRPGATLEDALKTSLPLKLRGIVNDINPKQGAAIIISPDGKEKSYHVGEKLPIKNSNVTLEYVFKDKVFIKNNGILEYIEYPKVELKNNPKPPGLNNAPSNQFLPKIDNNNHQEIDTGDIIENLSRNVERRFNFSKFRKKNRRRD